MLLSIIIVNYNVKYFLEQCLCSVEKAVRVAGMSLGAAVDGGSAGIGLGTSDAGDGSRQTAEIFVVDNHSTDGSAEWLPGRFPQVQFILNDENKGFGAANNQALALANGEYILFLNPDTILPEDCFSVCLAFMGSHPEAGAAGIRMIDGCGRFLKESMRGFPTPWVAFCKMSGLTGLFPRSRLFAGYYQGHLFPGKDHLSPILSGAYMFVRKEALDKTGGFDERFFLYAEDIDLSHRIGQAGYVNYYLSEATILHFKGESTPKNAHYVRQFYKAMAQFRRKYFRGPFFRKGLIPANFLMDAAIWGKAGVQTIKNAFSSRRDPEKSQNRSACKTWVCGDGEEAARLRDLLAVHGRISVSNRDSADEIIFCEGPGFSFKEIIGSLEQRIVQAALPGEQPKTYKIHATGTTAAVGSASKQQQGEVINL